jgi:hypothetical protein
MKTSVMGRARSAVGRNCGPGSVAFEALIAALERESSMVGGKVFAYMD